MEPPHWDHIWRHVSHVPEKGEAETMKSGLQALSCVAASHRTPANDWSMSDGGAHDSLLHAWLDELVADPRRLRCSSGEVPSGGWLLKRSRPQLWHVDFPELTQPPPCLDSPDDKASLLVAQINAEIKADEGRQPEALHTYSEAENPVVGLFAADGVPTASPEDVPHRLPRLLLHSLRGDPASLKELTAASQAVSPKLRATVQRALEAGQRVRLLHALVAYLLQDVSGFAFWAARGYNQERQGLGEVAGEEGEGSDDEAELDDRELYVWGPSAQGHGFDADNRSHRSGGGDYGCGSDDDGEDREEGIARGEGSEEQSNFVSRSQAPAQPLSGTSEAATDAGRSVVAAGFACALREQLRDLQGQLVGIETELWRELSCPLETSLSTALRPGAEGRRSAQAGAQAGKQAGPVGVPGAGLRGATGAGRLWMVMRLEDRTAAVREAVAGLWCAACELTERQGRPGLEVPGVHQREGGGEGGGEGRRGRGQAGPAGALEEHLRASLDSWSRGVWYTRGTRDACRKFMGGTRLLSRLYELLVFSEMCSACVAASPLRCLFQAALQPYLSMVHRWLTTGDSGSSDPYNEFLLPVAHSEAATEPRKVAIPSFLQPVAHEVETGGFQMALLMGPVGALGLPLAPPAPRVRQARQGSHSGSRSVMDFEEEGPGPDALWVAPGVPDVSLGPPGPLRAVRRRLSSAVGRLLAPMGCGEQGTDREPDTLWREYLVAESAGLERLSANRASDSASDSPGDGKGLASDVGPSGGVPSARCRFMPPMLEVQGRAGEQGEAGTSLGEIPRSSPGKGAWRGEGEMQGGGGEMGRDGEAGEMQGIRGEGRGAVEGPTEEAAWRGKMGNRGNRSAAVDDWLRASIFSSLQQGMSLVADFLVSWPQTGEGHKGDSTTGLTAKAPPSGFPPSAQLPLSLSLGIETPAPLSKQMPEPLPPGSSPGKEFLTYGQHCELLRRFFFLDAGPAALPEALLEALRRTAPIDPTSSSSGTSGGSGGSRGEGGEASEGMALQQAIQGALETCLDPSDPLLPRIILHISPDAASSGNATLDALERVSFSYSASWPGSLLLTPDVLAPYNALLRLLLAIAHAREVLHRIDEAAVLLWRLLVKEKGAMRRRLRAKETAAVADTRARTVEVCSQALHRLGVFRFAATGALNGLHTFVHHAATSASHDAHAHPACDPASSEAPHMDLFSIRQRHRERMERCFRECAGRAGEVPKERLWELQRVVGSCTDLDGLEACAARIGCILSTLETK